jgi:hypothetical protein
LIPLLLSKICIVVVLFGSCISDFFVSLSPRFCSKCLSYVFVPRPARVLRPPSITSVCFMFSLLNSCLSLCCFVATFMTFFSCCAVGTRLYCVEPLNFIFLLCVVPSVNVTVLPLASFTSCTSSLYLFSVPFLNIDVSSILTLSHGFRFVINPLSCALSMFKCMTCSLFLGSNIAWLGVILSSAVCGVLLYCSIIFGTYIYPSCLFIL